MQESRELTSVDGRTDDNTDPFDRAFDIVGQFGKAQWKLLIMLSCICFATAINVIINIWTHAVPDFACSEGSATVQNTTDKCGVVRGVTCPKDGEQCTAYTYDDKQFKSTVVTEYNLVCEKAHYNKLLQTLCYMGLTIGAVFGGILTDNLGRQRTLLYVCSIAFVSALVGSFAPNLWVYGVMRVIDGGMSIIAVISATILVVEFAGKEHRAKAVIYHGGFGWAIGFILLGIYAYYIRDWRQLHRCIAYQYIPMILGVYFFIPESPRWCITNGKHDEAIGVMKKLADGNGKKNVDLDWMRTVKLGSDRSHYNTTDLFRNGAGMIRTTVYLALVWASCGWISYGLMLSLGSLPGSSYMNNAILAVVPFPGYIIFPKYITDPRFGRRKVSMFLMGCSAVACLCFTISWEMSQCYKDDFSRPLVWVNLCSAFVMKFTISNMFSFVWYWSNELYPTAIRGTGSGFTSAAARIASMSMPMLVGLGKWMPGGFMTAVAVMSVAVCSQISETAGLPMMNTFEDARRLYSGRSRRTCNSAT